MFKKKEQEKRTVRIRLNPPLQLDGKVEEGCLGINDLASFSKIIDTAHFTLNKIDRKKIQEYQIDDQKVMLLAGEMVYGHTANFFQ